MHQSKQRALHFDGAKNVRDLGGIPAPDGRSTRFGVIYRADGLSRLSDADVQQLDRLSLSTIVDLRYPEERARAPDRLPVDGRLAVYHRGFLPQGSSELFSAINDQRADADTAFAMMRNNYSEIPFGHLEEFRDLMHFAVCSGNAPMLIHCTSGKDRTGIVVAFLLLAIGISMDNVLADYALSNIEHQAVDVFGPNARADAIEVIMQARPEYIQAAFDAIDQRSGSFDAYLERELKFNATHREQLAELLLD